MKLWWLYILLFTGHSTEVSTKQQAVRILFFVDAHCPIAQYYLPVVAAFQQNYPTRTVQVDIISRDPKAHFTQPIHLPFQHKAAKSLIDAYAIETIPQVVVLDSMSQVLYRGLWDDQVKQLGVYQSKVHHAYVDSTVNAYLTGKPIPYSFTNAIGCQIR
ncbi:MAG: hypothetical protein MUE33_07820 [Cytophagaceae bacterium]|jgi:hypothetical protein|nr:hypothetical protein [Cytophagaceae bacterium]